MPSELPSDTVSFSFFLIRLSELRKLPSNTVESTFSAFLLSLCFLLSLACLRGRCLAWWRILRLSSCLLQESLHKFRVRHYLRAVGHLRERGLIHRPLAQYLFTEVMQLVVLAYGQALDNIPGCKILGKVISCPLCQAW